MAGRPDRLAQSEVPAATSQPAASGSGTTLARAPTASPAARATRSQACSSPSARK